MSVTCPYCGEDADIDDGFHCSHCGRKETGEVAAKYYVEEVMEMGEYRTVKDGGEWPVDHCPECGSKAFVDYGEPEDPNDGVRAECFQCGHTVGNHADYDDPDDDIVAKKCVKCGDLFESKDGSLVCNKCWSEETSKD